MIDIRLIRESPELVKENIKKKFQNDKLALVDEVLKKDTDWRAQKVKADKLRNDRNKISKEIAEAKQAGKGTTALMKKAKEIPGKIQKIEAKMKKLYEEIQKTLKEIPNIMHSSVPLGKSEEENKELKKIGKPSKFDFQPKNHIELGEALGMLDTETSRKTSGAGFYYLRGDLALLNQALINYARDIMVNKGYTYVETPLMLRGAITDSVTDLADKENQTYKIQDEDLYLIGTSEHALIGQYVGSKLLEKNLPIKETSYSMCFRKERGAHGIEEKGLYRTHQFNKEEMIVICHPKDSMKHFEELKEITIEIFQNLEIPIRVLAMCSGDLGDLKHIQIDIEAWSPIKKEYYEVGSCSNLTDAQAVQLGIRAEGKEKYFPHTLNNTAMATSRGIVALLETHQQKDGSIKIPKALQPYMGGKKVIKKN